MFARSVLDACARGWSEWSEIDNDTRQHKACDAPARLHLLQQRTFFDVGKTCLFAFVVLAQALLEALVQEDVFPRAVKDSLSAS